MTSRKNRSSEYRLLVEPFMQDWAERGLQPWQRFRNWATQQILWEYGPSIADIEDATDMDGPRDKGIDAWYYDATDVPPRLILIQSKDKQPKREDLSKARDGFLDVMLPEERPGPANASLREKAALLQDNMPERLAIDIYLTSSTIAPQNLQPSEEGAPLYTERFPVGSTMVEAAHYVRDIKYLHDNLQSINSTPIDFEFTVQNNAAFEFSVGGHTRTIVAALGASELAQLFNEHRENLFRKNPRYYLPGSKRNEEIKAALKENQNADFFIYNNGLTCVSQAVRMLDGTSVRVNDFQIVNGCQTVASIWSAWTDRVDISKVRVLAKIIENSRTGAEGDVMSSRIAVRSNRQNVLKAEDWKSNDRRQELWHAAFGRLPDPWFYEIKRGVWDTQFKTVADKAAYRIGQTRQYRKVTLKDLGQVCYAFLGHPDGAQDRSREIFEKEEFYNLVFKEGLMPQQLLLPHLIFLEVDAKTGRETPSYSLDDGFSIKTSHARFAIVAAVGRMLRELAGAEQGYLDPELSKSLAESREAWLPAFVDIAFSQVARQLALVSKARGIGPRAIIRRNEWWEGSAADAAYLIRQRLDIEAQAGTPAGSVAAALPF